MITTLLATLLVSGLPEPYSELNLDREQATTIQAIVQRYEREKARLTEKSLLVKDSLKKEIEKNIETLEQRKDTEVQKFLKPDQKDRLKKIRKLEREGVPIGGGFFRTYRVIPHHPPLPSRFMSLDEAWKEEVLRRQQQDGVSFRIINRSGKNIRRPTFTAKLLDNQGRAIERHEVSIGDFEVDETRDVTILTRSPFDKLDIRFAD